MIKLLRVFGFIFLAFPLMAQNAKEPVAFEADSMLIEEAKNLSTLEGNVKLVHQKLKLNAERVEVYSQKNSEGEPDFTNLTAENNIKVTSGSQVITSDQMTYDAKTEIAVFTGNVVIKNGKNTATGNKAEVNMATGVHRLFGPVRGKISGKLP